MKGKFLGFAGSGGSSGGGVPAAHTHEISDIVDLQETLDGLEGGTTAAAIGTQVVATASPGPDWLECDNRVLQQSEYPDLFSAIGHRETPLTFYRNSVGTGLTTIRSPLLRDDNSCIICDGGASIDRTPNVLTTGFEGPTLVASGASIFFLVQNEQTGTIIASSFNHGPFRSIDDGLTWTLIEGWPSSTHNITDFRWIDNGTPLGVFVATKLYAHIVVSHDDGLTWTLASVSGLAGYDSVYGVAGNSERIVCYGQRGGPLRLFFCISEDGGVSWSPLVIAEDIPMVGNHASCAYYLDVHNGRFMLSARSFKGWREGLYEYPILMSENGLDWWSPTLPPGFSGEVFTYRSTEASIMGNWAMYEDYWYNFLGTGLAELRWDGADPIFTPNRVDQVVGARHLAINSSGVLVAVPSGGSSIYVTQLNRHNAKLLDDTFLLPNLTTRDRRVWIKAN